MSKQEIGEYLQEVVDNQKWQGELVFEPQDKDINDIYNISNKLKYSLQELKSYIVNFVLYNLVVDR